MRRNGSNPSVAGKSNLRDGWLREGEGGGEGQVEGDGEGEKERVVVILSPPDGVG